MSQRKERLMLLDYLSGPNQELVRTLPPKLVKEYEQGLDSIVRGQSKALRPFNSYFTQTNFAHTVNMLTIGHDILAKYPEIAANVDMLEFERQTTLHDGSESYPGAHLVDEKGRKIDLPAAGEERETEEGLRMKRRESIIFIFCMLPRIPEKSRVILRKSGLRYFKKNPRDHETNFTKATDGIEGTFDTGLNEMFGTWPIYSDDLSAPPPRLVDHLAKTIPKTLIPLYNLSREFPKKGRDALVDLADSNFKKLETAGFDEIAYYFRLMYLPLIAHPY